MRKNTDRFIPVGIDQISLQNPVVARWQGLFLPSIFPCSIPFNWVFINIPGDIIYLFLFKNNLEIMRALPFKQGTACQMNPFAGGGLVGAY